MARYFSLLVILLALSPESFCGQRNRIVPGKVFLLGGATSDSSSSIYNAIRESTGKALPNIVVAISAAYSLADGLDAYYVPDSTKSYEQLFTDYGFAPSVLRLARDNYLDARTSATELGKENINLIQNADVVFFNGGDQSRHSRSWLNDDGSDSEIMTILRSRYLTGAVVIAGTSAGAAIQSNPTYGEGISYGYFKYNADLKPCKIGETFVDDREGGNSERADINGGYMTGFGFVENALVDSHFDARGRFMRLAATMKNVNKTFGFGVEEDTALFLHQDTATVFGNGGVWMMDSVSAANPIGDHFLSNGIKIHYLTEGDSIVNWSTRPNVLSTKQFITNPNGTAFQSSSIFDSQQGVKSITSLVGSNSLVTIGRSRTKKPTCHIQFYKLTGLTKGYRTGDKYTVDGVFMDIEAV